MRPLDTGVVWMGPSPGGQAVPERDKWPDGHTAGSRPEPVATHSEFGSCSGRRGSTPSNTGMRREAERGPPRPAHLMGPQPAGCEREPSQARSALVSRTGLILKTRKQTEGRPARPVDSRGGGRAPAHT